MIAMRLLIAGMLLCGAAGAESGWTPEVFDYDRPDSLQVTDKGEPKDKLPDTRQFEFTFRNLRGEDVPVLLTLPPKGKGPWPAVLLVHALGSDRTQISRDLGRALTAKGFACVALDLPMHGGRAGKNVKGEDLLAGSDAAKTYHNCIDAVKDIRQTIDFIKQRRELDSDKGVPMVGYSLGAWLGSLSAAADRRVSMLVLQSGGAADTAEPSSGNDKRKSIDQQALLKKHPTLRAAAAIPHLSPRPLLMQNGKKDPFISPESVRMLYQLAQPPKELKWYDAGHILPEQAAVDAAEILLKNRTDH